MSATSVCQLQRTRDSGTALCQLRRTLDSGTAFAVWIQPALSSQAPPAICKCLTCKALLPINRKSNQLHCFSLSPAFCLPCVVMVGNGWEKEVSETFIKTLPTQNSHTLTCTLDRRFQPAGKAVCTKLSALHILCLSLKKNNFVWEQPSLGSF